MTDAGWRDIPGFPKYQAHPSGYIRSSRRWRGSEQWRILTKHPHKTLGYIFHSREDHNDKVGEHVMIALAFISNPDGKREINHKNGIKTDNRVENLEWSTTQENTLHRYHVLEKGLGEDHYAAKITEAQAYEILLAKANGEPSWKLAKKYGMSPRGIRGIGSRSWRHLRHPLDPNPMYFGTLTLA